MFKYAITYITLVVAVSCLLCSCTDIPTNDSPTPGTANADTIQPDTLQVDSAEMIPVQRYDTLPPISPRASDSIKRFITDDYPLRDAMMASGTDDSTSARKIRVGDVLSFDKAWFTDSDRQQTLVVELYTDMFRMIEYHFLNKNIPQALIEQMELHTPDGELATEASKQQAFNGFIRKAKTISNTFFKSNKGFRMNDNKQKAMRIYGTPDTTYMKNDLEILEWNFTGDLIYDGKTDLQGKPLANDSYGHQTTMMFRNNKLVALVLFNDIP